eukprot:1068951-Pyramimonas_sp.AAC.2
MSLQSTRQYGVVCSANPCNTPRAMYMQSQSPQAAGVYIESAQQGKMQWLGGFRNKRNGVTYLHATCQTDRKPKVYEKDKKFTRETQ